MNLSTVKWAQWDKTQSRELLVCSYVCALHCAIVAHNIAQNRPDNFPPYPPDNHHCTDDVYLREAGGSTTNYWPRWVLCWLWYHRHPLVFEVEHSIMCRSSPCCWCRRPWLHGRGWELPPNHLTTKWPAPHAVTTVGRRVQTAALDAHSQSTLHQTDQLMTVHSAAHTSTQLDILAQGWLVGV